MGEGHTWTPNKRLKSALSREANTRWDGREGTGLLAVCVCVYVWLRKLVHEVQVTRPATSRPRKPHLDVERKAKPAHVQKGTKRRVLSG